MQQAASIAAARCSLTFMLRPHPFCFAEKRVQKSFSNSKETAFVALLPVSSFFAEREIFQGVAGDLKYRSSRDIPVKKGTTGFRQVSLMSKEDAMDE